MRQLTNWLAVIAFIGVLFVVGPVSAQEDTPFVGIAFMPDGASGVEVTQILPGSPADEAGLEVGDIIVAIDDNLVSSNISLANYSVGDTATLSVLRDGTETLSLDITFTARPAEMTSTEEAPETESTPEGIQPEDAPAQNTDESTEQRPQLGVAIDVSPEGETGVVVAQVVPDSAAAEADLQVSDIITVVNGTTIEEPQALVDLVQQASVGDELEITFVRDGNEQTTTAILGAAPPGPSIPLASIAQGAELLTYDSDTNTWTVDDFPADGPLSATGLQPGDVITAVSGETITAPPQLFEVLRASMVDEMIPLAVERDGETTEVEVPPTVIAFMLTAMTA